MHHLSVVIAQADQIAAERLARAFRSRFRQVTLAHSPSEVAQAVKNSRADAAIVDLELLERDDLRRLCEDCPRTAVVVTHRSPDEDMWMACLEVGAADCLHRFDVDGMLRAISHNTPLARAAHAA